MFINATQGISHNVRDTSHFFQSSIFLYLPSLLTPLASRLTPHALRLIPHSGRRPSCWRGTALFTMHQKPCWLINTPLLIHCFTFFFSLMVTFTFDDKWNMFVFPYRGIVQVVVECPLGWVSRLGSWMWMRLHARGFPWTFIDYFIFIWGFISLSFIIFHSNITSH